MRQNTFLKIQVRKLRDLESLTFELILNILLVFLRNTMIMIHCYNCSKKLMIVDINSELNFLLKCINCKEKLLLTNSEYVYPKALIYLYKHHLGIKAVILDSINDYLFAAGNNLIYSHELNTKMELTLLKNQKVVTMEYIKNFYELVNYIKGYFNSGLTERFQYISRCLCKEHFGADFSCNCVYVGHFKSIISTVYLEMCNSYHIVLRAWYEFLQNFEEMNIQNEEDFRLELICCLKDVARSSKREHLYHDFGIDITADINLKFLDGTNKRPDIYLYERNSTNKSPLCFVELKCFYLPSYKASKVKAIFQEAKEKSKDYCYSFPKIPNLLLVLDLTDTLNSYEDTKLINKSVSTIKVFNPKK